MRECKLPLKVYYTDDFNKKFRKAAVLTVLEWCGRFFLGLWRNVDVLDSLRSVLIIVWVLVMPLLLIWGWVDCIRYYLPLKWAELGAETTLSCRVWILISVAIMVLLGVGGYYHVVDFTDYITGNWLILGRIPECISIKLGLMQGWIFCFAFSVAMRRIIRKRGSRIKIGIIVLIVASVVCLSFVEKGKESYIEKKTENIWFHKNIEDYEEHKRENNGEVFYPRGY